MWNCPDKARLRVIPKLYETEKIPLPDKLIKLHFFIGESNFYAVEFDGVDVFWGFVILNGDYQNAEWGYFTLSELKDIRVGGFLEVECEPEGVWKVRHAKEVEKICLAWSWQKPFSVSTSPENATI